MKTFGERTKKTARTRRSGKRAATKRWKRQKGARSEKRLEGYSPSLREVHQKGITKRSSPRDGRTLPSKVGDSQKRDSVKSHKKGDQKFEEVSIGSLGRGDEGTSTTGGTH